MLMGLRRRVYGITCLQVYLYYTEHSNGDGRFLKSFVGLTFPTMEAIWLLNTVCRSLF